VPLLTGYATFVPRMPFLALTQGAMPACSPRGKRCRMRDRSVADVRALVGSGMAQPPAAARATSASFVALAGGDGMQVCEGLTRWRTMKDAVDHDGKGYRTSGGIRRLMFTVRHPRIR